MNAQDQPQVTTTLLGPDIDPFFSLRRPGEDPISKSHRGFVVYVGKDGYIL